MSRARRETLKKVDYSKQQEFSDEDIFEDSEDEPQPKPRRGGGGGGRGRKKTAAAVDEDMDDDQEYNNRPIYTEKGYDPALPPIRERFPFLPEYEEDGSPKIELIVGRRPVDEKNEEGDEEKKEEEEAPEVEEPTPRRKKRGAKKDKSPAAASPSTAKNESSGPVEYEYLVKYKGLSYLHLEWKTGADLESMNKSAKGIYRRYLKKIAQGTDDDLENPEFDPSFAVAEKVIDEGEQEVSIELSDEELVEWEKQREEEMKEDEDDDDEPGEKSPPKPVENNSAPVEAAVEEKKDEPEDDWTEDEIDFKNVSLDRLRAIVNKDGPYYPTVPGCDNPYRDGYVTEPPKKPRASYLFFQCAVRSFYQKKNPQASQSELMTILGDTWRTMTDEDKEPFLLLAKEEAEQFDKERALMERAQRANELWQPLRRAMKVLDRLEKDSFADIFLEPVDTEEFTDYDEFIDIPMDLGTVRQKLMTKKYQAPEQFARDMRRVWNNCKIYNQHGSAIWYVADYMSKLFERLYHAWVLEFRERYLRWADPRARPWEHSCRVHDGKCSTPDNQMVLCDHCDGMYGLNCLDPPLKKPPQKAWQCPDCKPKLKMAKGSRMLSAVAEQAARKRAELGEIPKKKIKQIMYLVKWAGLGYEYCTWETRADVGDDKLIAAYHKLNNTFPDEPDLPQESLNKFLSTVKHLNVDNAGGSTCIPALRAQLYAQSRAFHFTKFGMDVPSLVCSECGPKTKSVEPSAVVSSDEVPAENSMPEHPREITECVTDIAFKVARGEKYKPIRANTSLPPLMTGEYDAVVPITSKGLMMNVGEIHGSVAFLGYRQFPDGTKGPSEQANLIRNVGDKIIAVDGTSTIGKSFKDVIALLRESGKNKFAYMRFLENMYGVCEKDLASVGSKGRYAIEELQEKFATDRRRLFVQRKQMLAEREEEAGVEVVEHLEATGKEGSDAESEDGSEGEFQPESDDEEDAALEPVVPGAATVASPPEKVTPVVVPPATTDPQSVAPAAPSTTENAVPLPEGLPDGEANTPQESEPGRIYREETTRSLAVRLLDVEVGYSSDEGGDEDCAYFVDGVDDTFTCANDLSDKRPDRKAKAKAEKSAPDDETVPAKQTEFSSHGERAKLAAAMALTPKPPSLEEFDNFPFPAKEAIEEKMHGAEEVTEDADGSSPTKSTKRSTVKVEQVSNSTGEVLHIWANVEAAAATLQLPLNELRQVLRGEYDEDIGEEVGGFKWRYALAGAKVTAGTGNSSRGGGGKKAKEAWLEFRDKLYDPNEPHSYKNGNKLRDYQVDGVNWLASTWYKRQGCILADEMGLGKTVQIVCYIEHLFRAEKIQKPFLVVVPLSTVEHWRREFEGWTDMVCCVYHDRQRVWRDVMREYEWYYEDRPHTHEFLKFDVLVTTYDTLIGDFDVISQIPFRVAVVDEAHRLRNQKGKLLECMREISARGTMQYGFQSRVLMSGTPLQNDLNELWTLLNFIQPFEFPDLERFQYSFGNMANREQVENLQQQISPYMLRRVKEDVAKDIPAKEETVIDVELTSIQKQYYRAIFEHNHAFLSIGATRQTAPKLMNIQMELRKVCNHPFLLEGVEHRESERQYKEFVDSGSFDGKAPEDQQHMLNEHGYIMTSGKMVLLDKLLPKLRQEGHKILIFSQMVRMLDLISEYCEFRDFRYERLDGRVRGTDRQKAIDRFETDKDSFLFLLSTRAGGVGINLTAADICIIFDSDWNPQNDIQAQARCHRIGQTKDVRIYRLVTSRSFEQEMFDRASKKLGLEQAVLGTFEKGADGDDKPTQAEMEQLLKKGAYALLEDENDEITKEFCADDIESILAKRTRTRVVEGTKTASWLNKQGMVVSKSKFTAEAGKESLDMDDPLFWQKVMPDFVTPSIMLHKLNELQDEIEGVSGKGRGRGKRGRGRGRPKKSLAVEENGEAKPEEAKKEDDGEKAEATNPAQPADDDNAASNNADGADALLADETLEDMSDDDNEEKEKSSKVQLSRTNVRKIHKFMSDLNGMMEGILDEADDEALPAQEKDTCQQLLLTISVKEKIFNEEQRHLAKYFLKKLEGDRRRRCRTSEQPRFNPGMGEEDTATPMREELMIVGKKRKKRRKRGEIEEDEPARKRKRRTKDDAGGYLGEDGYLHHSDSEADWSDVAEDMYQGSGKKRERISRKEARRRRHWAAGDDPVTAAGRAWPVFPRHLVTKVLSTVLDEVVKYDKEHGGIFCVPVPKDEFPEYYEQIKKPMDYGTMKTKLENGEYRSAQAMQKDFILILQNCRSFNADSSDIVKEAREQHMMRPEILKEAAVKHELFLAEDGSVLEIFDDEKKSGQKGRAKKAKNAADDDDDETVEENAVPKKKKTRKKKSREEDDQNVADDDEEVEGKKKTKRGKSKKPVDDDDGNAEDERPARPRIRIKVKGEAEDEDDAKGKGKKTKKKGAKRKKDAEVDDDADDDDDVEAPPPKKRKKADGQASVKKKRAKKVAAVEKDVEQDAAETEVATGGEKPDASIFVDAAYWKQGREQLDGSFEAARAHLTQHGPWALPDNLQDKMADIAKATLDKLNKYDRYSVFAEAVTDEEAPDYSDVVKNPMDFGTMGEKLQKGAYGEGSKAAALLYEDFLLVFDNCELYNPEESEVTEEAARILGLLPETFANICTSIAKK